MTTEENIKEILHCYFAGFKESLIDLAAKRIMQIKNDCPYYDGYNKTCRKSEVPNEQ